MICLKYVSSCLCTQRLLLCSKLADVLPSPWLMKTVVIDGCDEEPADSAALLSVIADMFLLEQRQLLDSSSQVSGGGGIMERLSARMRLVNRVLQEHTKIDCSYLPELLVCTD